MGVTSNLAATGRQFQYVPTLRTKAGEVVALRNLQPLAKQRTVPIFQLAPRLSTRFAADIANAWSLLPIALDGTIETANTGTAAGFNSLFSALGNSGSPIIPVVDIGAAQPYLGAVAAAVNKYAPGLILRAPLHSVQHAASWLTTLSWSTTDADLLIDCGHIADIDPQLILQIVTNVFGTVPLVGWRSITLTASAAPKDASALATGPNMIPRRDWQLWQAVATQFPGLNYGDYGIAHRDLTEPPGYAMANATVSVRYTLDADWLIRKGRSTRGVRGLPMTAQYHSHAQAIVRHPGFGQVPGCWADAEISRIASRGGAGAAGGRQTWIQIGVNRHISLVCHRLP